MTTVVTAKDMDVVILRIVGTPMNGTILPRRTLTRMLRALTTLCFHCGDPCHNADSCTRDVERHKDNVIKDIYFQSRRLLEREREHNLFTFGFGDHLKDKFDLTAQSHSKYAILWAGFPVRLGTLLNNSKVMGS